MQLAVSQRLYAESDKPFDKFPLFVWIFLVKRTQAEV